MARYKQRHFLEVIFKLKIISINSITNVFELTLKLKNNKKI